MEIKIYYNKTNILKLFVDDDYFTSTSRELDSYVVTIDILNYISKKIKKKAVQLVFYQVMDETIKYYEELEEYRYCQVLLDIKQNVEDLDKRKNLNKFNETKSN